MKKARKKTKTTKAAKDAKRKDETDKENIEKVMIEKYNPWFINVVSVIRVKLLVYPYPSLAMLISQVL